MTMICRIGVPDTAPLALALLAQRAGQGKGRGARREEWDKRPDQGSLL